MLISGIKQEHIIFRNWDEFLIWLRKSDVSDREFMRVIISMRSCFWNKEMPAEYIFVGDDILYNINVIP